MPSALATDPLARLKRVPLVLLLLLLGCSAPPVAAQTAVGTFRLANGLDVVVIPDQRLPVVTHMLWYRVGGADEPRGRSGLAHLLEHLMFKATGRIASGEFSRIITRLGGIDNATTTPDATYYYQRVAKDRLKRVMQLEADRMLGIKLDEAEIQVERMVVFEERRSDVEGDPISVLSEQMLAALYQNHPYGTPVLGWPHEVVTLTKADALPFYKRYYAPNNAILVVAGDVTEAEVRALATEVYGPLSAGPALPERVRPSEPPPRAARRVVLEDARTAGPTLVRFYLTPSVASAQGLEAESLEILARVLGHGDTSRLSAALVLKDKVAVAAAAMYVASARDSGRIAIFALPAPGVAIVDLEAALDLVVAEVRGKGLTAGEVDRARKSIEAKRVFESDSQLDLARQIGEALTAGRSLAHILEAPRRLEAVTKEDIATVATRYLDPRRSVTGVLLPEPVPAIPSTVGSKQP